MYGGNKFGFSHYDQYEKYWRPAEAHGSNAGCSTSKQLGIMSKNQWQILAIVLTVVGVVSFSLAVYNSVLCSGYVGSSTAVTTSSRAVTTDSITSSTVKPEVCLSGFIQYGDNIDRLDTKAISVGVETGLTGNLDIIEIYCYYYWGEIDLTHGNLSTTYLSTFSTKMVMKGEGGMYYHEAISAEELEVIRCLVGDDDVQEAYVFTSVNLTRKDTGIQTGTFQTVVALSSPPVTYVIRTYGDDLQPLNDTNFFSIYQGFDGFDQNLTFEDVLNNRLVTKINNTNIVTEISSRLNATCGC